MQTVAVNDRDSGSVLGGALEQRQFSIHKNGGIQWEAGQNVADPSIVPSLCCLGDNAALLIEASSA